MRRHLQTLSPAAGTPSERLCLLVGPEWPFHCHPCGLLSACNLPVSGGMARESHTPCLLLALSHGHLLLTHPILVLQTNAFDYLNGEYRAKKLSRFTKVCVCVCV